MSGPWARSSASPFPRKCDTIYSVTAESERSARYIVVEERRKNAWRSGRERERATLNGRSDEKGEWEEWRGEREETEWGEEQKLIEVVGTGRGAETHFHGHLYRCSTCCCATTVRTVDFPFSTTFYTVLCPLSPWLAGFLLQVDCKKDGAAVAAGRNKYFTFSCRVLLHRDILNAVNHPGFRASSFYRAIADPFQLVRENRRV